MRNISLDQLKGLVFARLESEQNQTGAMQRKIAQETGTEIQYAPSQKESKKKILTWISEKIAKRLYDDNREISLISEDDSKELLQLLKKIVFDQPEYKDFENEDLEKIEKFLDKIFQNTIESFIGDKKSDKNQYEEYWKWIDLVLDIAEKYKIDAELVPTIQTYRDIIIRGLLTREEYEKKYNEIIDKSSQINVDLIKSIIFKPFIELIESFEDEELKQEFKEQLEIEYTPKLQEVLETSKKMSISHMHEEMLRIYGV